MIFGYQFYVCKDKMILWLFIFFNKFINFGKMGLIFKINVECNVNNEKMVLFYFYDNQFKDFLIYNRFKFFFFVVL